MTKEEFLKLREDGLTFAKIGELYNLTERQLHNILFNLEDSADLINLIYKNSTEATRLDRKYEVAKLVIR